MEGIFINNGGGNLISQSLGNNANDWHLVCFLLELDIVHKRLEKKRKRNKGCVNSALHC